MTIENSLERIAVALEKLAAGGGSAEPAESKPAKPAKAKAAKAEPAPEPTPEPVKAEPEPTKAADDDFGGTTTAVTREDVRAALVAYQKKVSPEKARGLLKTVGGVDVLSALPEEKFAAVILAAT
jgi:hypothetical protein